MVVCSGDVISVTSSHPASDLTVNWNQSLRGRTQKYYPLTYFNKTRANESEHDGAVFIQADMWDAFKRRCNVKGEVMEITVNGDFQYGQRKDGTRRFLVFHQRDQKPYQHRFIESALGSTALNGAQAFWRAIDCKVVANNLGDMARPYVGDYLYQM